MTFRSLLFISVAALGVVAGCGSDSGTTGALGQSSTTADCAPNDTACQNDGLDAPLAEGATLPINVRITAKGVAAPKLTLESARTDVVAVDSGQLVGKGAGFSSVLMLGEGGVVMDFVTLTVERPDRVELYRLDASGGAEPSPLPQKIQLAPGDDFEVSVKAFSGATRLLGELDGGWSLEGNAAMMLDSGRKGSRRVRAKAPGSARLVIKTSSFEKSLDLEVLP